MKISSLIISWCHRVNNEGILSLSNMKTLKELNLRGCVSISSDSILELKRKLKTIRIYSTTPLLSTILSNNSNHNQSINMSNSNGS